jgi:hypothetical protein
MVHARRYYFSLAAITLKKGQNVKLVLLSGRCPAWPDGEGARHPGGHG